MSLVITNNLNAIGINRNLNATNYNLATSLRNLSSGYKINTGADDPAGIVISELLRSQTRGIERAITNTLEAQNVLGIVEGALVESNSMLTKLKSLAIHASNTGVTSAEQIAADQAEIDSTIQTIDRIGRTTTYSSDNLMNGSKRIEFSSSVNRQTPNNYALLDRELSEIYQINSKSKGTTINLSFAGKDNDGNAVMSKQATRAYFELDAGDARLDITSANGLSALSKDQSFTLTGNQGSRLFAFATGTTLGEIVTSINNTRDSVGVEASLIFGASQTVDMLPYVTVADIGPSLQSTDFWAGNVTSFNAANTVQNAANMTNDFAADRVDGFRVQATTVGVNQVQFDLFDSIGGAAIATQTVTLGVIAGGGLGSALVNFGSVAGTNVNFNYNYGYDVVGATFDRATGNLFTLSNANVVTNNNQTYSNTVMNAVSGVAGAATVAASDLSTFTVTATNHATDADKVVFTMTDNFGRTLRTQTETLAVLGAIGNGAHAVTLTSGNGTSVSFNYNYGNDTTATGFDRANGNLFTFNGAGTTTNLNVNTAGLYALPPTAAVTGLPATATVGANDNVTSFTVRVDSAVGANVTFKIIDNLGRDVKVINAVLPAVNGEGAYAVNFGAGTNLTFNYRYTGSGGAYNYSGVGNILSFSSVGVVNNLLTTFNSTFAYSSTPGAIATAVGANDLIGNSWRTEAHWLGGNAVQFRLVDNTGKRDSGWQPVLLTPFVGAAGFGVDNYSMVNLTAGNTRVNFEYWYENNTAGNLWDAGGSAVATQIITYTRAGASTIVLAPNSTDGPGAGNVRAPTAVVAAAQNMSANISIFDIVGNETPFQIWATKTGGAGEITFELRGATTNPLDSQVITLNPLFNTGTGFQIINLATANGSTVSFRYYYENDPFPVPPRYDLPVGNLFNVNATQIQSERIINGLTSTATALGGVIDVNYNPATPNNLQDLEYGLNTDGQGRIFLKIVSHDTATRALKFEIYKDAGLSAAGLIGEGGGFADGITAMEIRTLNNSKISGEITFDDAGGAVNFMNRDHFGQDAYLAIGGLAGNNGADYRGNFSTQANNTRVNTFQMSETAFSGIELGKNTDQNGKIYFKTVMSAANRGQVMAYKDARMRDEDLVAISEQFANLSADREVVLNPFNNSGLGIFLRTATVNGFNASAGAVFLADATFTNLGVRISAAEYGSNQTLSLTQHQGQMWTSFSSNGNQRVISDRDGTIRLTGQDAIVSINGQEKICNGLTLNLATLDLSGKFIFSAGVVGNTTVAQVGYSDGSLFTNAEFLTSLTDGWENGVIQTFKAGANLTNAGHATTEVLGDFRGGMQLQLGEGADAQNRTVIGVSAATALDLGKTRIDGKMYALNDLMFGGFASLVKNPVYAMKIIEQASHDVTNLRARLGAWQANLLQTNANSLEVAMENITKTESYIRDTDMAICSTAFTRNQVLVQAGTSMLAQANNLTRNALALLQ